MKTIIQGTNWSTPRTNIFSGMNSLRECLSSGSNAVLIKAWNEECEHPISISNPTKDIKNWEFSYGTLSSENEILASNVNDFNKNLNLNYKTCYGTKKAMDHYYMTRELSKDNFRGVGVSHIVKRQDAIDFWTAEGEPENAEKFTTKKGDEKGWFDFFKLRSGWNVNTPKKFKRKLWVVQMVHDDDRITTPILVHIIAALVSPLKWIPKKRVLQMKEYKNITFILGDVINGYSIEFQIPKKFSF